MTNRLRTMLIFILIFIAITDTYTFRGVFLLTRSIDTTWLRLGLRVGFWIITAAFAGGLIYLVNTPEPRPSPSMTRNYYAFFGLFLLLYIPKLIFIVFQLAQDITYLIQHLVAGISHITAGKENVIKGIPISRLTFISRIGLIVASIPFISIIYGMLKGRWDFRVRKHELYFPHLPEAFEGLRIAQISDIHIGSFYGHREKVEGAIEQLNSLNADFVFFTGDLVNNFAEELEGWIPVLSKIKAGTGKYSILGNHDYGDYYNWSSEEAKQENLSKVKAAHAKFGFRLFLNENAVLESKGEQIALIGVENWGLPPFKQYGDLDQAIRGVENIPFKILLSHDPSHFDAQVLDKTDIALTLSGHTHGMQFGIEIKGIKWSPVKYKYPRWAGLYTVNGQKLYVNRGFGYIGYPGRIGMPPEITVLELHKG